MVHELKEFCEERNFKGALKRFGNDYKKFSEFVFKSDVPLRLGGRYGLERILSLGIQKREHREGLDPHAIKILKKELRKREPNFETVHKTTYWLSGGMMQIPDEFRGDKTKKSKVKVAKKLLESEEKLLEKVKGKDKENLENALAHAAITLFTAGENEYLKNLKTESGRVKKVKLMANFSESGEL